MAKKEKGKPVPFQKEGFYYMIGFHYQHGKKSGFGSFEQAVEAPINSVIVLRNIMQMYQQKITQDVRAIRKSIPWYRFWDKLGIPKAEIICNALTFQLLRQGKITIDPANYASPEFSDADKAKIVELNKIKQEQIKPEEVN
jgi:hypothetical protein